MGNSLEGGMRVRYVTRGYQVAIAAFFRYNNNFIKTECEL